MQSVKQLTKQFEQMRKMMKAMSSGKMPNPEAMLPRAARRGPSALNL